MPREKDSFRDHVKFLPNNKWKCNFCSKEYGGSVTRIKAHLAGVAGYGINDCKDVDGRVRSEARNALKCKGAAEPSSGAEGNVEEGPHLPVTANNEDAWREPSYAAMPYLSSDVMSTVGASSSAFLPLPETNLPSQSLPAQGMIPWGEFPLLPQQPQSHAGDSYTQPRNFSCPISRPDLAPEPLTNMPAPVNAEEGETNTEVPQDARTDDALMDSRSGVFGLVGEYMPTLKRKLEELSRRVADLDELETWYRKSKRIKDWSMVQAFREGKYFFAQQVERVDDLSKEIEEILGYCSFQRGLTTHGAGCRKSSPLVTTKLVGKKSEQTIKEICDYLMDDEIFIIGVYGMGGVGKTAILMHVHNRILENSAFNDVFWVTVPQEFSFCELQDEIANAVGLDNLSKDKDVKRRASMLNRHLKKKRAVLILDGLWMHFDFEDVGIPVEKGGIKLVLTTRSQNVCHEMLCQKQIEIEPLAKFNEDDWSLFREKLCFGRELPSEVKKIAKSIVDKCGGLPLGIIEIATHMRGVEEVHEWKGMLWKLEESRVELNVFKRLKLSYVNLGDSQVQQCFLHLAQVYQKSDKTKLIESFIDEGLLDRIGTWQELYEQGNIILDKLRKGCLCDEDGQHISLHSLIRGMALHIMRSTTHMVKAEMGLKEIPEEEFWTDRLEKVFLQGNDIQEIPDGVSPNCPKLTSLSLNNNKFLEAIHESFFKHLKGLKVLDLSFTRLTKLPNAISYLESLEALLLRECKELRHIPYIGNLKSLRKLDVCGCKMLGEVPEGMEMLVKLRYLNLSDTHIETLLEGVLGKLVNLQYLVIKKGMAWAGRNLKKAEGLYCSVSNVETFNACVRFLEQNSSLPYQLWLNESRYHSFKDKHERHIIIESCHSIAARVDGEIGGDGHALLPKNVLVLEVGSCGGVTSLCEIGPLDNLEELTIEEWEKLEELGAVHFPHLRRLKIAWCSKLKHLLEEGQGLPRLHWLKIQGSKELEEINIAAPLLYSIEVYGCPKMKRVVKWEWLATRLPNLRSIKIKNCEKLEEIIGGGPAMPIGATCLLAEFELCGCNNMKGVLLTHDMLLRLPYLQDIRVGDCKSIEVIIGTIPDKPHPILPNLIRLTLWNLPELKSICDEIVSWILFRRFDIRNCPKLKRLPLADNGLPYPSPYLESICINQMTWESLEYPPPFLRSILINRLTWRLSEWEYPFSQPSLEHLVRFHGKSSPANLYFSFILSISCVPF
ncbi:probable disease resistance protein At1g61300 isoform X5 [Syzygium oleosum]|uniref:probable disease resistance protein At1g61300 isoform X5 n=1 Tax=Syzygium oleosum TaxID=219896 RepID=UPI0024BB872C|nr:probable disease resistance protein At1g61300 isoform X5 [Syzygium oleosum]